MEYREEDVVITGALRTPIGSFKGALSSVPAHDLGTVVVKQLLSDSHVHPHDVSEVILGQVYTAGKNYKI